MSLENYQIIDLTQPLSPEIPTWTGSCGFYLEIKQDYDRTFCVHQIKMHAGAGTHMDAPTHLFKDTASIGELSVEEFVLPACVINVSKKANATYEISVEDIENYEKNHGLIPPRSLVIGYTGWSRYFSHPQKYRGIDAAGQMHFPSFSGKAAELLLTRNIAGIAIDTLSPDSPQSSFPVHQLILGAGKYIIENIADCSKLPAKGAYVIALPIKAVGATESPIRMIALIPKQ